MSLTACGSAEDDGDTGTTSNGDTGSSDGARNRLRDELRRKRKAKYGA
jgi:hypothetical protein